MKFSNSVINTYFECPAKFYWTYIRNLEPVNKNADLDYGTVIHSVLAEYFTSFDRDKALRVLVEDYQKLNIAPRLITRNKAKTIQTGEWLLDEAIQLEIVKPITPAYSVQLKVEKTAEKQLPSGIIYRGKIDLEIYSEISNITTILDWKTTSNSNIIFKMMQWELSRQFKGYCWLKGVQDVKVVILNALMSPDVLVHSICHTEEELELWVIETNAICQRIYQKVDNILNGGVVAINALFPRAATKCQIYSCPYFSLCIQGRLETAVVDPSEFVTREDIYNGKT